jgi:hypothetical protein
VASGPGGSCGSRQVTVQGGRPDGIRLDGKVVLVTGTSPNIGGVLAAGFGASLCRMLRRVPIASLPQAARPWRCPPT